MNQQISLVLPYLRHFHAIAENRNLRRAAVQLNLSAPAVTHALNQLEISLGVTLCLRSRSGFELTSDGRELYEATKLIFAEMTKYSDRLTGEQKTGGHLAIGVIDQFENAVYDHTINELTDRFPRGNLSIVVLPSEEIGKRLLSGDLDIGFGVFWERSDRLRFKKIGEERLAYYISQKHPLFKQRMVNRDSVQEMASVWVDSESRSKSSIEREVFQAHERHRLQIRAFTNGLDGAIRLLRTGKYIVPLPDHTAALQTGEFRKIEISRGPRVIAQEVCYNPALRGNPMKKYVVDFLLKPSAL